MLDRALLVLMGLLISLAPTLVMAQGPTIMHIQPDVAAPGMTVAVEILAHVDSIGAFGSDGIAPSGLSVRLLDNFDTQRVIVGIPVVSWQGRMIQVPFFIRSNAFAGPIPFRIVRGSVVGNVDTFFVEFAQPTIRINGSITLGDNGLGGRLSKRNTLLVNGLEISGEQGNRALIEANLNDPDPLAPGNPRLLPLTILSLGPVKFSFADLRFEARGKSGAPGGGGGGSGDEGTGGYGYTGGGSSTATSDSNQGSGSEPTIDFGGRAPTGVKGGFSSQEDQGGGGGTGHPFGLSGSKGQASSASALGGFGAGSAGGENSEAAYGGGGGAFATKASAGIGSGDNGGNRTGGRLLLPLAGGSGGGAGNSRDDDLNAAGSGGGGGGAISIVSFDSLTFSNTNVIVRGDSGTTGVALTGSGGGGSGGGFVAASTVSIRADRLSIDASGGVGGKGSTNGFAGGEGSPGMSRLDGLDTCTTCTLPATNQTSLSQKRLPVEAKAFILVEGLAGSGDAFDDDIRIFYRNHHTGWVSVDTVSFLEGGKRKWRKLIPALNDSVLFVSAYQKINSPRTGLFDQEPAWISTHVSHQIVRSGSRAEALTPDTLFFPNTKVGRTAERTLLLRNIGEATLELQSIFISPPFEASPSVLQVGAYSLDSVKVSFKPTADSCYVVTATLRTNAGDRPVVLVGCGIKTDEQIQLTPPSIVFRDTRVGKCDEVEIRITSVGVDPVTIRFEDLFQPPFSVDTVGKRTRLAKKNDVETFVVRFCPTDSGLFYDTTSIIDLDKQIFLQGKGLRRILAKRDTVLNEDVCLNYSMIVEDTIYNVGNEDILITNVAETAAQLDLIGPSTATITPANKQVFQFRLTPSGVGQYEHLAEYFSGSDLLAIGRFLYVANSRTFSASIGEFYSCADTISELDLEIANTGSQGISILVKDFGSQFSPVSATTFNVSSNSSGKLTVRFDPSGVADTFLDTITIIVTTSGCEDTAITAVLKGIGTKERLVFSKLSLDFGDVEVGTCASDSIFITNVCGPDNEVDPETLPGAPGFKSSLVTKQTLKKGDGIWVVYEFCPTADGEQKVFHRLTTMDTVIDVELKGVGRSTAQPLAALHMTNTDVIIGQSSSTVLMLDSLTNGVAQLDQIELTVNYDPSLLRLTAIKALRGLNVVVDSSLSGTLDVRINGVITAGPLTEFSWSGLLGAAASDSLVLADVKTLPSISLKLTNGYVTLSDCFGLAGRISPGGLVVSIIRPQPVENHIDLAVRSLNDVRSEFRIRDAAGRTLQASRIDLKAGDQLISLPCSSIPAGAYWLDVTAAGYRNSQSFWR
jgi:hypothetical protein